MGLESYDGQELLVEYWKSKAMKFIATFIFSIMLTATAAGSSLPLPHPEDLVGDWVVFDARQSCSIHFGIEDLPRANGYRLTIEPNVGACNFVIGAVAWRPAPDGISLLDQEGATLIFFSQEVGGYRSEISGDRRMRLRRTSARP